MRRDCSAPLGRPFYMGNKEYNAAADELGDLTPPRIGWKEVKPVETSCQLFPIPNLALGVIPKPQHTPTMPD